MGKRQQVSQVRQTAKQLLLREYFAQFYNVQSQTYAEQIDKAGSLFDNINGEWFANFYDVEFVAPKVYIALGNGKHNYFVNGVDGSYDIVLGPRGIIS